MSSVQHETVLFSGHVQGVGFRYTTLQVSKEYEVAGHVRNLPDSRVLLEVEGAGEQIEAFLRALQEALPGCVRGLQRSTERREPQFHGFEIR